MNLAVIGNTRGWHHRELARAASQLGWNLDAFTYSQLSVNLNDNHFQPCILENATNADPIPLLKYDGLLLRAMGSSSLQQIVFRMDVLNESDASGLKIINSPKTIEFAIDKFLTLAKLQRNGLPIPDTLVVQPDWVGEQGTPFQSGGSVAHFFRRHPAVILKPLFGSEGKGLQKLTSLSQLNDFAWRLNSDMGEMRKLSQQFGNLFYLQEYLPASYDVRILIVGSRCYAAKRTNPGHWIRNICQGAKCEPYELTHDEMQMAKAAAQSVNALVAGVDLMHTPNGPVIIEVNAAPGWKGVQSTTDTDIAVEIIRLFA